MYERKQVEKPLDLQAAELLPLEEGTVKFLALRSSVDALFSKPSSRLAPGPALTNMDFGRGFCFAFSSRFLGTPSSSSSFFSMYWRKICSRRAFSSDFLRSDSSCFSLEKNYISKHTRYIENLTHGHFIWNLSNEPSATLMKFRMKLLQVWFTI